MDLYKTTFKASAELAQSLSVDEIEEAFWIAFKQGFLCASGYDLVRDMEGNVYERLTKMPLEDLVSRLRGVSTDGQN